MNSVKLNLPRKVWNYPANHEINFLLLLSLTVFWEWRVSKKLAANCLCTRLLASSCSLHQGHRQFFPSKVNSRVNFAVTWFCARNKHKEVKKNEKSNKPHGHNFGASRTVSSLLHFTKSCDLSRVLWAVNPITRKSSFAGGEAMSRYSVFLKSKGTWCPTFRSLKETNISI